VNDASAKVSSILTGNIHQFGNFDECLGIKTGKEFSGKYCLAFLQLRVLEKSQLVEKLINLTHVFEPYTSNLDDVGKL
jgi:hypothetical protein